MTDENPQKQAQLLTSALPMYLSAQVTTLLFTVLDTPLYLEVYRTNHVLEVTAWLGVWFVLVIFGLANAVFLLLRDSWRRLLDEPQRAKLALGYFLGGLIGLLTLGIRFIPIISPNYFLCPGAFAVLAIGAYLVWKRRAHKAEELFP